MLLSHLHVLQSSGTIPGQRFTRGEVHINNSVNHWCCCLLRPILVAKQVIDWESSTQDSVFSSKKANSSFNVNVHICNCPCLFNINRIELIFSPCEGWSCKLSLFAYKRLVNGKAPVSLHKITRQQLFHNPTVLCQKLVRGSPTPSFRNK